jgi:uncharacterized membrane protein YphA (DoxX/SURF4 family)
VAQQVSILGRRIDADWVSTVARAVIGLVFAFSGFTKVVDIDGTVRAVRNYRILPEAIVPTVGTALPVLELALAVLLLTGLLTRLAAIITVPLSAAFFLGVASAWARGLTIQCGCFGNGGPTAHPVPGYVRELVLNAVLIAAALWLIRHPRSRGALDGVLGLSVSDDQDQVPWDQDHGPEDTDDGARETDDTDPSTRSIGVQP